MNIKKSTIMISSIIGLIPMGLYLYFYNQLPEKIATSFGFDGAINGYTDKGDLIFLLLLPIVIMVVLCITPRIDPKKKNYEKLGKFYDYFIISITALLSFSFAFLVLNGVASISIPIGTIVPVLVGILFMFIGNYMPKMKQTYTMGIKTPWTLDNEVVWNKTHRLGGKCFILMGAGMLATPFFPQFSSLIVVVILVGTMIPVGMSYVYYQQEMKKK